MKKLLIQLVCIFFFGSQLYAQSIQGYYIDNHAKRVDGWIEYRISKNSPESFRFMKNEDGKMEEKRIDEVKEWGIGAEIRFIRSDVKVDQSPAVGDNMSEQKDPVWIQKRVFLSVLVEGSAGLY